MDWYWWRERLGRDHARHWGRRAENGPPRPRVLLESPDGAEAHAIWSLLNRYGYDTMWCPGPSAHPARDCALVRGGHCPLVDGADVIVNALDQRDRKCGEVARRVDDSAAAARSRPVVVVRPPSGAADLAASLPHCDVVPGPLRSGALLRLVTLAAGPQGEETHNTAH